MSGQDTRARLSRPGTRGHMAHRVGQDRVTGALEHGRHQPQNGDLEQALRRAARGRSRIEMAETLAPSARGPGRADRLALPLDKGGTMDRRIPDEPGHLPGEQEPGPDGRDADRNENNPPGPPYPAPASVHAAGRRVPPDEPGHLPGEQQPGPDGRDADRNGNNPPGPPDPAPASVHAAGRRVPPDEPGHLPGEQEPGPDGRDADRNGNNPPGLPYPAPASLHAAILVSFIDYV